jgi:hypothetical protein
MFTKFKKNRTIFLAFTLITPLFIIAPGSTIVTGVLSIPIINMNYQSFVSSGDIHHTGIITTSRHGMPMGTGSMGSLVWSNNDHTLNFQINRVDVFGWNSAATGSLDGHNDYGYGCGFVNVDLGGNPLISSTSQHLSLYDGKLAIKGNGVNVDIIGDTNSDVFALKIDDTRPYPSSISIDLVMLQDPIEVIGTHTATTKVSNSGGQIRLKQIFEQPAATGYKQFDHYCSSAVVADVAGRSGTVNYPDSRTVHLTLPAATGTAYVYIGSHASMNSSDDVINLAADKVNSAKNRAFDSISSGNQSWWQNFWSRSYIHLPADSTTIDIQRKWLYFLYMSAISQRGAYPAKFTGNLFNTGGRSRSWGSTQYWGYNQEPLHYSFDAANHGEFQEPVFKMYLSNYDKYATAAKQQWGSQGIFINETDFWNGPELLPSNIAYDLRDFMINGNGPSTVLSDFAKSRNRMHSRWELWPTYWTTFTTINASERAEHFWNHYLYTGDTSFLSTQAYPILKGASEFYRNFPNLKLENGKYHIYRTNLHEHIMGGKDIIDDLVFIKGVMQATIKASKILGVDSNLRPLWQDIVDNLISYPVSGQPNTIGSITHHLGYTTWAQARIPAAQVRYDAIEKEPQSPRLRMLENYDVLTLETKDQGLDGGDWAIANNSFEANVAFNMNMSLGDYGSNLSRFLLDAAALGRSEYSTVLYNLNSEINSKVASSTNRLGFVSSDWAEFGGYGILSSGLQDGLMQSISATPGGEPVIRVFPAWDKNKPAYFKLLAKGGFLVSSSVKNGEVSFLEINSQLGGTCRIRNPWPGSAISLYRNGVKTEDLTGYLISFATSVGEDIKIMRQDINPDSFHESIPMSEVGWQ